MRLFFSVGEPSGDQHAAHLIRELKRRRPDLECVGYGGPAMQAAGCHLHYRLADHAVMGVFAVFPMLWTLWKLARQAKRYFETQRPDMIVLVDFPDFNWWIADYAKRAGIPVMYYVPPQMWAWKSWRVEKIRRFVDDVVCALPFEPDWYAARGVPVNYFGHPFFDEVADHPLDTTFLENWSTKKFRNVAILPGSRDREVRHCFPIMVEAMRQLHERHPNVRFLVGCYKESHRRFCNSYLLANASRLPVQLFVGKTSEVIQSGECCLMVSGSVSLEVLGRGKPAAVLYWSSWPTYLLGKALVHVKYGSLPNLFVDREVMPEALFVGRNRKPLAKLVEALHGWLSVDDRMKSARAEMQELKSKYAQTGATTRTADLLLQRLTSADTFPAAAKAA